MSRRALQLALWAGAFVTAGQGCSGNSIVIGGDPLDSPGGVVSGGASFGGAFPEGGVSVGGAFPAGGVSTFGGSAPIGGTSTGAGGSAEGGDGSGFDPYPRVAYEGGQGYRRSCPQYDDTWGFTCWNFEGEPRACSPNGEPYCNACSCASPRCDGGDFQCPFGITGHSASCIGSETTAPSCFLVCDDGRCPTGMTCSRYPATAAMVCVWLSAQPFGQPPLPP